MIDHPAAPWIASAILLIALGLFAWGRLRYDLVALIALVAVGAFGLVEDPADLVAGFGHPAVVTVAAVLIISRGLQNAGVATLIARQIRPLTKTLIGHIAALSGTVAFASAFMNNVGAIAVFLPVAIASAKERGRNPSLLLMPLAFGSILGGLMTLIGTPPNIIIASFRAETAGTPFNLFDFTPVGLPVALAGLAFLALAGWRLIPKQRTGATSAGELFSIGDYLTEVEVVEDSPLIGKTYALAEEITGEDVVIVGRAAGDGPLYKPAPFQTVRAGDILVLRADPTHLDKTLSPQGLRLVRSEDRHEEQFPSANSRLVEAVIKPGAQVEGASADYLRWRSGYALDLLAIARQDTPLLTRIRNQRFEGGDVVLLQADATISPEIYASLGLLPLPERDLNLSGQRRVVTGISIFAGALGLSALGLVPIVIAFLGAIVLFVLTG
ncbi:MAG: SLC13 family permease, partial [Pseudomonadota bacterium]